MEHQLILKDISSVHRNFVVGGVITKFGWGQRTDRTGIWGR